MPQTTLLAFMGPVSVEAKRQPSAQYKTPTDAIEVALPAPFQTTVDPSNSASEHVSILEQLSATTAVWKADFVAPTQSPDTIICKIQPQHIPHIKQLNGTLLPVRYPDKFFDDCIQDPLLSEICWVVLHRSKPVGWIRCRLEPTTNDTNAIYIQAIGVLAPWRGLGLATALVEQVTKPELIRHNRIEQIYAHVWQTNEDALEWYEKRGFQRTHLEPNYYRRLRPAGAWIMRKSLDLAHDSNTSH